MAMNDRDADGRGRYSNGRIFHDLLGLIDHFHLFFGVAVLQENVDLRQAVKGNLVWVNLFLNLLRIQDGAGLTQKLIDGFEAGAGNRLIGGNDDPFDAGCVMNGL